MRLLELAVVLTLFVMTLGTLAVLSQDTERGGRIIGQLLVAILGDRRREPRYEGRCCVNARAGHSDAGFWLHRVREHGDGA